MSRADIQIGEKLKEIQQSIGIGTCAKGSNGDWEGEREAIGIGREGGKPL